MALEAPGESQGLNEPAMKFGWPLPKPINGSKNGEPTLNRSLVRVKSLAIVK